MGVWSLLRVSRSVCDCIRALDVPGAGCPRGGSTPPAGRCGISAAPRARRAIGGALSTFVCVVTREPPPLAVRCVLFSVDREWGVSVPVIGITCFVGLRQRARQRACQRARQRAHQRGPASEPRLDLKPMGGASGFSFRSNGQPRYIAVVYYIEKRRHSVFWSASCCICGGLAPLKATRIPNPRIPLGTRGLQRTRNSRALTPAFRKAPVPLVGPYPQAYTASQLRSLRRAPGRIDHRPVPLADLITGQCASPRGFPSNSEYLSTVLRFLARWRHKTAWTSDFRRHEAFFTTRNHPDSTSDASLVTTGTEPCAN